MHDVAEFIHRQVYPGKSGRANANQGNIEFQEGYQAGSNSSTERVEDAFSLIKLEAEVRGFPEKDTQEWENLAEWKRGFWAARLQKAFAEVVVEMEDEFPG